MVTHRAPMLTEPDGIEIREQVDRQLRKTRWDGKDRWGRWDRWDFVPEASGVPAKVALLGLRTEEAPLEDHASNPYCWWFVSYPGPISGYSPTLWQ